MWETLAKQADETKHRGGPINLRRQLQSETYNGVGPISEYISRILSYRDKLALTPQKLSKDEVIAHILIGLPQTWSTISTIIENQPLETQTLDDVVNTLNTHEKKLATQAKQTTHVTMPANALISRRSRPHVLRDRLYSANKSYKGKKQSRDQDQDEDSNDDEDNGEDLAECWYCLRKGHFEKDCRTKQKAARKRRRRERLEQESSKSAKANIAAISPNIADAITL
jgi:hypothetical protein